jgi:hypothetical protein
MTAERPGRDSLSSIERKMDIILTLVAVNIALTVSVLFLLH